MRKLLSYLWLPITASVVVILLYGSLNIVSLRIKNQNLEQKQNELRTKITQLEKEFDSLKTIQVAGVKDEQSKTKKLFLSLKEMQKSRYPLYRMQRMLQ